MPHYSNTLSTVEQIEQIKANLQFVECEHRIGEIFKASWDAAFNAQCDSTYLSHDKLAHVEYVEPEKNGPYVSHYAKPWNVNRNATVTEELERAKAHIVKRFGSMEAFSVWVRFMGSHSRSEFTHPEFSTVKKQNRAAITHRVDVCDVINFVNFLVNGELFEDNAPTIKLREAAEVSYNCPKYKREFFGVTVEQFQNGKLTFTGLNDEQIARWKCYIELTETSWHKVYEGGNNAGKFKGLFDTALALAYFS